MNLNQLLIDTLSAHGPVFPDHYEGDERRYLVFNYPDEAGAMYGDNRPGRTVVDVQVHFYLDKEEPYQNEKEQICRELKKAGFLWPDVTILFEEDTGFRHLIFETKIKKRIKWED